MEGGQNMNGKILIKKPNICVCFIKIDETVKQLVAFKYSF